MKMRMFLLLSIVFGCFPSWTVCQTKESSDSPPAVAQVNAGGQGVGITVRDPDLQVTVQDAGRTMRVVDRTTGKAAQFDPRHLSILLGEGVTSVEILGGDFSVTRTGTRTVEIRRRKDSGRSAPSPPARAEPSPSAQRGMPRVPGESRILQGHTNRVVSVAISPDGRQVASASWDGTVRLWDLANGSETRRFEGHGNQVFCVAFSPDGRRMASGGVDGTVCLRDVETGQEIHRIRIGCFVHAVAFSPDGRRLMTGGLSKTIHQWDVESGGQVHSVELPMDFVSCVAYSPDGRLALCTGGYTVNSDTRLGTMLRVWNVKTGETVFEWKPSIRTGLPNAAFSPKGQFVMAVDPANRYRPALWDIQTGEKARELSPVEGGRVVAFSPDGHCAVVGTMGGVVHLLNVERGDVLLGFGGHPGGADCLAFSPDGSLVVSGGADKLVRVTRVPTAPDPDERLPGEVHRFFHERSVFAVAFSPDGKRAISSGFDLSLRLWDLEHGRQLQQYQGKKALDVVNSIAFSPDGGSVLLGAGQYRETGRVSLWDVEQWREIRQFGELGDVVRSVAMSPDGRYAISADSEGNLICHEAKTGEEVSRYEAPVRGIRDIAISPDSRYAAYAGGYGGATRKGRVGVWNIQSGQNVRDFQDVDTPFRVSFCPDGNRLLSADEQGAIRLWDVDRGQKLRDTRVPGPIYRLAFSSDGWRAAVGEMDGSVRVWDIETSRQVVRFDGHNDRVTCVAISPDGRSVLSGSSDCTVRLWRLPDSP